MALFCIRATLSGVLPSNGTLPVSHFEQDDAERVDVGPLVDVLPLDLLGGHVFGRADERSRGR